MLGFGAGATKSESTGSGMSFGGSPPSKGQKPKETVTFKVHRNQIVECIIPYATPRAKEVREVIKEQSFFENRYIWCFRALTENPPGWTNVARNSTTQSPMLSAPPVFAVEETKRLLSACDAVGTIKILDMANQTELSDVQLRQLPFEPLPGMPGNAAPPAAPPMLAPPPAANALADQFENAAGEAAEWADALAETKPITYEETIDLMNTLQLNLTSTIKVQLAEQLAPLKVNWTEVADMNKHFQTMSDQLTEAVNLIRTLVQTATPHTGLSAGTAPEVVRTPKKPLEMRTALCPTPPSDLAELRKILSAQNVALPFDVRPLSFYQDLWVKHIGQHFRPAATSPETTKGGASSTEDGSPASSAGADAPPPAATKRSRKAPIGK